jgi:hypothetical protein
MWSGGVSISWARVGDCIKCLGPSLCVNGLNRLSDIGRRSRLHLSCLVFLLEGVVELLSLRVLAALISVQVHYLFISFF